MSPSPPTTAWKEKYYAAHRTAPFPQCAFIPTAIALAVLGYSANVARSKGAGAGAGTQPSLDWRNIASGVLGLAVGVLFNCVLVPRQDLVAQVVVQNKARVRMGPQLQSALQTIQDGHVATALILVVLVCLQLAVAVEHVVEAHLSAARGAAAAKEKGAAKGVSGAERQHKSSGSQNGKPATPKTL